MEHSISASKHAWLRRQAPCTEGSAWAVFQSTIYRRVFVLTCSKAKLFRSYPTWWLYSSGCSRIYGLVVCAATPNRVTTGEKNADVFLKKKTNIKWENVSFIQFSFIIVQHRQLFCLSYLVHTARNTRNNGIKSENRTVRTGKPFLKSSAVIFLLLLQPRLQPTATLSSHPSYKFCFPFPFLTAKSMKNVVGHDRGGPTPPSLQYRVFIFQLQTKWRVSYKTIFLLAAWLLLRTHMTLATENEKRNWKEEMIIANHY